VTCGPISRAKRPCIYPNTDLYLGLNSSLILKDGLTNMRDVNVSEGIVPLGEFKARASKIIGEIADSDEPIVITQNGRPAAVLMSPAAFQELRERYDFLEAVAQGVADTEAGRVVDHKKVRRWLDSWGSDLEKDAPK
jgi:prevent-host-death family protein